MLINLKKIIPGDVRRKIMYSLSFLPDKLYIQLFYYSVIGKLPNLKHPQGFNEKLQWLKLHEDYSKYRGYADKLKVREIIREKIGDGYMFPVLGQWKSFDDIDFDSLPNEFVLKCNHDSGSVKIIRDKSALTENDFRQMRKFYENRLKYDFFFAGREPCYQGIERYIFAEQYMTEKSKYSGGIKDYKIFCFNGIPKLFLYISGRQTEKHEDHFDMDYHWMPEIRNGSMPSKSAPEKPLNFEKMKEYAQQLSAGMKHVRLDLYEIDGKLYFGEYTFFSGGGFEPFYPAEWEQKLGDLIQIDTHN